MRYAHPILGIVVALFCPIVLATLLTPAYFGYIVALGVRSSLAMAVVLSGAFLASDRFPALQRPTWIFSALGAAVALVGGGLGDMAH